MLSETSFREMTRDDLRFGSLRFQEILSRWFEQSDRAEADDGF